MATFSQTTTSIAIHRTGESPIFGYGTTLVSLIDNGGGPFIELHQIDGTEPGQIKLDYEELLLVADAAKMLMEGIETKEPPDKAHREDA